MHTFFSNIFITSHFSIKDIDFQCICDTQKLSYNEQKSMDMVTHIGKFKNSSLLNEKSLLMPTHPRLVDIVLLLTLGLGNHVQCDKARFKIVKKSSSSPLFLSEEIGPYLDISMEKLTQLQGQNSDIFYIFKTAFLLFYETKFYTYYSDIEIILLMNCFEYLLGALFRIDKSLVKESEVKFTASYKNIIEKFRYQTFVDKELEKEIPREKLKSKEFRKGRNLKFSLFSEQFNDMRNWIAHGMHGEKKERVNSPSNHLFTFSWRLEEFIRIILIDLIFGKNYERKFDILYQLILENNVNVCLTPEFAKLRFK